MIGIFQEHHDLVQDSLAMIILQTSLIKAEVQKYSGLHS